MSRACGAMVASRRQARGVTLVELMVAMAIAMALIAAVAMLFLNTRVSQKSTDERSQMRETGQLALDILGRQLANAGFYPMIYAEPTSATGEDKSGVLASYAQAVTGMFATGVPKALATGVFGCTGQVVKADLSGCENVTLPSAAGDDGVGKADSDSLTVAYFTADALSKDVGWRMDCTRADVAGDDTFNTNRVSADTAYTKLKDVRNVADGLPPAFPMLAVNQFLLRPVTYMNDAGGQIATYELACRGNGRRAASGTMMTMGLLPGVEQLVVQYGVSANGFDAPSKYVDAKDVTDADWPRVLAVRVCVMVRNLSAGVKRTSTTADTDCRGNDVKGDGVREVFVRTLGIKNRLGMTLADKQ